MNIPDLVNGGFEFFSGIMTYNNCRVLYNDKRLAGVSIASTVVFMSWGFWNLFYYPNLHQWWSFAGGVIIVSGNVLWVILALYYGRPA
jgi:hypothetical protein